MKSMKKIKTFNGFDAEPSIATESISNKNMIIVVL